MTGKRVSVKIQPKKGSEEAFFAERDQRKLRELREKAAVKKQLKNIAKNISIIVFGVVHRV